MCVEVINYNAYQAREANIVKKMGQANQCSLCVNDIQTYKQDNRLKKIDLREISKPSYKRRY